MKKKVILILSFGLVIILVILLLIFGLSKQELKVFSFDHTTELSFGKQNVKKYSENRPYSYVDYYSKSAKEIYENVIIKSEYFLFENEYKEKKYAYLEKDGYFYKATYSERVITIYNCVAYYGENHVVGFFSFEGFGDKVIGIEKDEEGYFGYRNVTWDKFFEENNNYEMELFNIHDKESILSFYDRVNENAAYYDSENDILYLKAYCFLGREEDQYKKYNYSIKIVFNENGYEYFYRNSN